MTADEDEPMPTIHRILDPEDMKREFAERHRVENERSRHVAELTPKGKPRLVAVEDKPEPTDPVVAALADIAAQLRIANLIAWTNRPGHASPRRVQEEIDEALGLWRPNPADVC